MAASLIALIVLVASSTDAIIQTSSPGSTSWPPAATRPTTPPTPSPVQPPSTTAPASEPAPDVAPPVVVHESVLLEPPGPTVSPTFGSAVAFAGDQVILTGPVISQGAPVDGQIASLVERDGAWKPNLEMPGVRDVRRMDFVLQRVCGAPGFFATNIDRKSAVRSGVVVFTPEESPAGWRESATLSTPGGEQAPGFGSSIVTDGTFIMCADVDTRFRKDKAPAMPKSPAVHVFTRNGTGVWERVSVLRREGDRNSSWFGTSLATDGARLAIGSPRLTNRGPDGPPVLADDAIVQIRRRDGANWPIEAEIDGASITRWPGFGMNVAIGGDVLAVRATEVVRGRTGSKVFVFRKKEGVWAPDGELVPTGVEPSIAFGAGLAVVDGRVLVGNSHGVVPGESPVGLIHGFERVGDRWQETFRLVPRATCGEHAFGSAFDVSGNRVLVGRVRAPNAGVPNGGAFLFDLPPRASSR